MNNQLMNNHNNPNVFVLDSLLEHPGDWTFHDDPTYKFITHKSGLCLNFHEPKTKVFSPDWAKLYKFSSEDGLLINKAILSLKKERDDAAKITLDNRLARMFGLGKTPKIDLIRLRLSNMIAHPLFWAVLLSPLVVAVLMAICFGWIDFWSG